MVKYLWKLEAILMCLYPLSACSGGLIELDSVRFVENIQYHYISDDMNESSSLNDKDSLSFLCIGNSYNDDALEFLPTILNCLNVTNIKIGKLSAQGIRFIDHYEAFLQNEPIYTYSYCNSSDHWIADNKKRSFSAIVNSESWDYVVFQEAGGLYGFWDYSIIDQAIMMLSSYSNEVFVFWHITWGFATCYSGTPFSSFNFSQSEMYSYSKSLSSSLLDLGFGVIPSYETFDILRHSRINNPPLDLTRDGYHADYGVGRFAAACTWYESLIAPHTGISVLGVPIDIQEGNIPVDKANFYLIEQAAVNAVNSMQKDYPL